jgi:general secretion pathway protein H
VYTTHVEDASWARGAAAPRARGFTLIEILVVVVLIAITVTLVAVRLQPDDRQIAREEATRLAALLTQARDEAITTGAALAWRGAPDGYRFLRRDKERVWQPFPPDEVFRPRSLTPPLALAAVEIAGRPAGPEDMLVFSSTGVSPPFRIVLQFNAQAVAVSSDNPAQIRVDAAR